MSQTVSRVAREFGSADLDDVADALARELANASCGSADRRKLRAQLRLALEELRGSVSYESLSEMAVRLACHRLEQSRTVLPLVTSSTSPPKLAPWSGTIPLG